MSRLSLLRAPKTPDPEADQGRHRFEFAIMPHQGRLVDSNTLKLATQFTNPLYCKRSALQLSLNLIRSVRSGSMSSKAALPEFRVTGHQAQGIVLETIKRSEDGTGVVLRLYESLGGRAKGTIKMSVGNLMIPVAQPDETVRI